MVNSIQKLREATGAGVMECKKALEQAKGDFDRAITIIHERGIMKAESKRERKTGAGLLETYIHNERVGVLLELRAETDFVVRSEPFRELAHELAMQIAAMNPENVEELLKGAYIKDESLKMGDFVKRTIAKVGENIVVERFCRYEV
ncbi:MAG: Elongation factor Ts [Candidatus Jorgensenbacteria bacterium GW2011_GWA1_48_11]|uniref:Elongation factor Ts n=1 Tax=Candidatus Jorgensenbacteria bacterium GW2011_GWA1_48_11 TaxID=1618660 RepID=A0A0G1U9L0_9BACT|nr:MAG: Elongation factor Ts [Candidatus Jorgensenbacteria bacterium GW2011_GWA1_48_11]KKW12421.1 MAG: Elongation factor Ts [Candidatus Jorgensenbacteria bacterium GW2011_GWB1_49_9]